LWRGFTIDDALNQCFGVSEDPGKGRQMPVHYCSKRLNLQAISSTLATQIPQAVGAGYTYRISNLDKCAVAYFGEGAASEGDFAPAINFAAVLKSQVLFICRNNGFAISTPVREQYKGDGIASRGIAYGLDSIRVDGNDIMAVYKATQLARELCINEQKPVVLELMTYRLGHHSTSDESGRYRQDSERLSWQEEGITASGRFKKYLLNKRLIDADFDKRVKAEAREEILKKIKEVETMAKFASLDHVFTDVYDTIPWHVEEQRRSLQAILKKYPEQYNLSSYESSEEFPTNKIA